MRGTPCLPKSPKLVAQAPRRSFNSCNSSTDQLQAKLRKLLNADSKENLKEVSIWFIMNVNDRII